MIGAPLKRDLRVPRVDPESGYTEREAALIADYFTKSIEILRTATAKLRGA